MTALFAEGDTVLAYHGPMIYESKVLKFQESSLGAGRFQYYVHYLGWNKKWDEWVDDHRYVLFVSVGRAFRVQLAPAFARSGLSPQTGLVRCNRCCCCRVMAKSDETLAMRDRVNAEVELNVKKGVPMKRSESASAPAVKRGAKKIDSSMDTVRSALFRSKIVGRGSGAWQFNFFFLYRVLPLVLLDALTLFP